MKMVHGMEVGVSQVHIVLDEDVTAPLPKKGDRVPEFWANLYCGWMHQDATWYE